MRALGGVLLVVGMLAFNGCGSDDLPEYRKLEGLRVLAMIASSPEVTAGATVTVTPLISDINGAGRTLQYEAFGCVDPGVGLGAAPNCDGNPTRTTIGSGSVTGLAAPGYTGLVTSTLSVTVPASAVIFAGRNEQDQFNGVAYIVSYKISAASGESVMSIKRVIASTRATKNTNPTLNSGAEITSDGAPFSGYPTGGVDMRPGITAGSMESYSVQASATDFRNESEQLRATWFASVGTISSTPTDPATSTRYSPVIPKPAGVTPVFVLVVHDGRGGAAAAVRNL